jgi:hypothetical protein
MDFFFNELSIQDQFRSRDDFRAAVLQFRHYRNAVTGAGFRLYIHRRILERPVLGQTFRKGIQRYCNRQQVRTLMNWLSKSGFFLPDDACAAAEDRFTCHWPEESGDRNEDVTGSALAECTFRHLLGEDGCVLSLEQSEFHWSPMRISFLPANASTDEAFIDNDYSLLLLTQRLAGLLPPITSWAVLLKRIAKLPGVSIEPDVEQNLGKNPFAGNVAKGLYGCATALSEMATAATLEQFNELFTKYATGDKARFSDSSPGEKRNFKGALTFAVDGKQRLCPYHGKVKIQQYRMHLVDRPAFGRPARIVYIGPKLTKR